MDPLQLPLRDIHLPGTVSWWPPAPGWWLLSALVLLALSMLAWLYVRRKRYRSSPAYQARILLQKLQDDHADHGDDRQLVRELSVLLRRICVTVYPRTETASLVGKEWLALLDRAVSGEPFSRGAGRVLIEAPYQKDAMIDADSLLSLGREWIESVTMENRKVTR